MRNAWLIRPVPDGKLRITEFKENEIIAIGWPGIGDLSGKSRMDLKCLLANPPYRLSGLELGNAYATIDIFVNQIKNGDLILTPNGDDIHLGEVASDYYFDFSVDTHEEDKGYPHQRKAKWIKTISRNNLSKDLRSSLKVHRTAADLSRHAEEIESLCNGQKPASVTNSIDVTYPLRTNFNISFKIPKDMSCDEAQRLSSYFASLYFKK